VIQSIQFTWTAQFFWKRTRRMFRHFVCDGHQPFRSTLVSQADIPKISFPETLRFAT
jgi:hypothetical protein